jgi:hypothetical protein
MGNVPSTSSDLPRDDKTATCCVTKGTERFDYSIKEDDSERAEQNYFADEEMKENQGEENNIPSSSYRLLCTEITQKNIPGNQTSTLAKESESTIVFLKPKIYQCHYCQKVFFHSTTYRRHMIRELKKLHWCFVCKRGFESKLCFKKHKLFSHKLLVVRKTVR